MSNLLRQTQRMKNRIMPRKSSRTENVITTFGRARLVRLANGATELRGGQSADQTTAKEWISLFMHEAVLRTGKSEAPSAK
ncbi:MAG: hypothetical protein JWQ04_561 [Pedosphaera sp.]|nr:hypothetical protein [Pedosphaera sp.]